MTNISNISKLLEAAILRQKGEKRMKKMQAVSGFKLSEPEIIKFVHELKVHQNELETANKKLLLQYEEKDKRAAELIIANQELTFQNQEKEKRAAELVIANKELVFQNEEKERLAAELIIANQELLYQTKEKKKRAAELIIADEEKEKRADELVIADEELLFQNEEKEKRAAELIVANKELLYQSKEKKKRAAELIIADEEKEKRADELVIADEELLFQTKEKIKRAEELIIANKELVFQNEEKEKRAAELVIALQRAESADRLKSIFLSTMSHELRTPLNSIIGFSGILLQEFSGPLTGEQKKQLDMVQLSGRHLLSLINTILDISTIESGTLTANYESFKIQDVIEDVLKIAGPEADDKGLSINIIKAPLMGEIVSDRQRVQQVIFSLVDNAIKFTEKGSVTITCYKNDDSVKIEISDTGIGIKKENLAGIFNPFIQIDNKLTRKFEGSGLGLSISEKLMELLQGKIEVKSEYGVGSTFIITLPLKLKSDEP